VPCFFAAWRLGLLLCFQLQSRLWNWEGRGGQIYIGGVDGNGRMASWRVSLFGVPVRAPDVRSRTVDSDDTAASVNSWVLLESAFSMRACGRGMETFIFER
jgi:hypothetical protein